MSKELWHALGELEAKLHLETVNRAFTEGAQKKNIKRLRYDPS